MYLYEQERMNEMWDDYFAKGDDIREREDLQREEDLKNNANQTQK